LLLRGFRGWPGALLSLAIGDGRPFRLTRRSDGLSLLLRSPLEIWIAMETCLQRQYEMLLPVLPDDATVVDIGASVGDHSLHVARQIPGGRVVAVEPDPGSFALLQANIAQNRARNILPIRAAVTAKAGEALLCSASRAAERSTAAPSAVGAVSVPATTLDLLFEEQRIDWCDLLKIDCEGGEFEILFGAAPSTLARIGHVCLEYHDGVTAFHHDRLVRFFEERGFEVRLRPDAVHTSIGLLDAFNSVAPRKGAEPPRE
jgi:FkbM family methyltransferase